MPQYAKDTDVPADRTRQEIERTLQRYGADSFAYGWEPERAVIAFQMRARRIKFVLPLPDRNDKVFRQKAINQYRTISGPFSEEKYEQAVRQRWRALALAIKAKLESVESGIETFEDAFMAQIMLPDGQTVGEWMTPQIERMYLTGNMPPLLPGGKPHESP